MITIKRWTFKNTDFQKKLKRKISFQKLCTKWKLLLYSCLWTCISLCRKLWIKPGFIDRIPLIYMRVAYSFVWFTWRIPYADFFGGISNMPPNIFEQINGFSNQYEDWGLEDDDLYRRYVYGYNRLYNSACTSALFPTHFASSGTSLKNALHTNRQL